VCFIQFDHKSLQQEEGKSKHFLFAAGAFLGGINALRLLHYYGKII
jgi:hypothetical protein